jgi:hypothetical protein
MTTEGVFLNSKEDFDNCLVPSNSSAYLFESMKHHIYLQ